MAPLSVYFAENKNKGEAYGKLVKFIIQLCLVYGVVDVAQTKAMLMVHGGEDIAVLEIADYISPAANLNRVETLAELATRIGVNFLGFGLNEPIETVCFYWAKVTSKLYNQLSWITDVLVVFSNVLDNVSCQMLKLKVIVNQVKVSSQMEPVDKPAPVNIIKKFDGEVIVRSEYRKKVVLKYPKLFKENSLGKFNGFEAHLYSDPNVVPSQSKIVRTPIFLEPIVNSKVNIMRELDVVEQVPVGTPTTWIVPLRVVTKKTGSGWRVTLNMVKRNQAILRQRNTSLTVEEVRFKVKGAKWITKFDVNKALQQKTKRIEIVQVPSGVNISASTSTSTSEQVAVPTIITRVSKSPNRLNISMFTKAKQSYDNVKKQ